MIKMETTEKFFVNTEDEAENLIAERKKLTEGDLIDYKVSEKETKDGLYYIVVLKTRFANLQQCKEGAF